MFVKKHAWGVVAREERVSAIFYDLAASFFFDRYSLLRISFRRISRMLNIPSESFANVMKRIIIRSSSFFLYRKVNWKS